nr:MAG: phosphoprotein [Dichorhavirus sp. 'monocotyledonae']WNK15272.1 MAG: phosphoprotein [Dichorhavirus sp. 'monocotyledonae']
MNSNIGSSLNLFPDAPEDSQVMDDINSLNTDDPADNFVKKWIARGISPPVGLSAKIREMSATRGSGMPPLILDDDAADLCCLVWNVSAKHHHLINRSQVNKLSNLIDQLGEIMTKRPLLQAQHPPSDPQNSSTALKRKAPEPQEANTDLEARLAGTWTEERRKAWNLKPIKDVVDTVNWLLRDFLKVTTKTATADWVGSKGIRHLIGDIAIYAYINREVIKDTEISEIASIVSGRLANNSKRPCLD